VDGPKPFGIRPDQHKICGKNIRGYLQDDFEDAWRPARGAAALKAP
jgi:hypothetical protein